MTAKSALGMPSIQSICKYFFVLIMKLSEKIKQIDVDVYVSTLSSSSLKLKLCTHTLGALADSSTFPPTLAFTGSTLNVLEFRFKPDLTTVVVVFPPFS